MRSDCYLYERGRVIQHVAGVEIHASSKKNSLHLFDRCESFLCYKVRRRQKPASIIIVKSLQIMQPSN